MASLGDWIEDDLVARFGEGSVFRITPEIFDEIDDWIRAAERTGRNTQFGMDALVQLMARTNQAIAKEKSRGPVDPRGAMYDKAWKIPVRRITGRYYRGWRVRRITSGVWMLYNDSREAYFIEYGINHVGQGTDAGGRSSGHRGHKAQGDTTYSGATPAPQFNKGSRRVRRPIRKISLIATLRFMAQTRAEERVWEGIFSPFRQESHNFNFRDRGSGIVRDGLQSVEGMRNI